ncbi:MAG TPA: hypothetical protein VK437_15790 [Steroidobacteraceae bacterium]|nr:hypothetical protein [Steroidobacteraceae bacterium]
MPCDARRSSASGMVGLIKPWERCSASDSSALDGAATKPDAAASELDTAAASELDTDDEQLYLIDLRYRQYLAQRAVQELFTSGELCCVA